MDVPTNQVRANVAASRWRGLPLAFRLWAALQLLGPIGIVLVVAGVSLRDEAALVGGLVLCALFALDTAVGFPLMRASRRRRH